MMNRDELRRLARREARRELWRQGLAWQYLLDTSGPTGGQQAWLHMLRDLPPGSWAALEVARQRGKTFSVLEWTVEDMALQTFGGVYLAQTQSNAHAIVGGFLRAVMDDLPPEWDVRIVDGSVRFASLSELSVFGTDNDQFRRRRGNAVKRVLADEAGFYADLLAVEQVYVPQLQTTGGTGVYLSSPALTPGHQFSARCDAAKAAKRYVHDTFWSNPRLDHEAVIRGECERLGLTREDLLRSTYFRREYLAERVTEESRAAVPAWNAAAAEALVREWPMPSHYDGYEGHDGGLFTDPHASLFAVHDPANNCILVVDELEMPSATTTIQGWADAAKAKEKALYGTTLWNGTLLGAEDMLRELANVPEYLRPGISQNAPRQPYLRTSDPAQDVCRDLTIDYGFAVIPSPKHEKALNMDLVNQLVVDRRLRIHPRCKRLVEQLYATLWDKTRRRWERTDKDHGDLIDCLSYIVRNVRWHRDCRPKHVDAYTREVKRIQDAHTKEKTGWVDVFKRR